MANRAFALFFMCPPPLATNLRPPGCEKLAGAGDRYRVRPGAYRIVYEVPDEELVVVLVKVGHRSDVYKNL
ncbi:MAG: type II toxin-antitoxin system RelE/ParE family toxin [Acidobacteriia bacterium]|nr:type II toxin-antitoxin system RelE/ParE family toxin [Terriglobia bacterium]